MSSRLTVAWISDFPIEWMPDIPASLSHLPRAHPATWQIVLLSEFERNSDLNLHIVLLRKNINSSLVFKRNGVTFHVLKYPGGTRRPSLFWTDTLLIRRTLNRINPNIVHAWGSELGAALIASRLRFQNLVTVQGLLTWHNQVVPSSMGERILSWMEYISFRRARYVTIESEFGVSFLRQRYPHLAIYQIEHAPNWLFHRIERRPQVAPFRFIFIGRLGYGKGSDLLLQGLSELAHPLNFELIIVGSPNESFMAPFRQRLPLEFWKRIQFKTNLEPREVSIELATATMLLLPTRVDNSPNAVKEAVVAGVPVVASNIGGIPDYVFPNENGVLFAPGDLSGFIAAVRSACNHPLFQLGNVSEKSLVRNRAYLSPNHMAESFLKAYRQILQR